AMQEQKLYQARPAAKEEPPRGEGDEYSTASSNIPPTEYMNAAGGLHALPSFKVKGEAAPKKRERLQGAVADQSARRGRCAAPSDEDEDGVPVRRRRHNRRHRAVRGAYDVDGEEDEEDEGNYSRERNRDTHRRAIFSDEEEEGEG